MCVCVCVWLATPRKKGLVRLGHVLYSSSPLPSRSFIYFPPVSPRYYLHRATFPRSFTYLLILPSTDHVPRFPSYRGDRAVAANKAHASAGVTHFVNKEGREVLSFKMDVRDLKARAVADLNWMRNAPQNSTII